MKQWQKVLFTYCLCFFEISDGLDFSKCRFRVTSNGTQTKYYDLSGLTVHRLYKIPMPLQNENYTEFIFLSVCGKFLNIDASICPDTSASVCVAKETKKGDWIPLIKNAGKDIEAKENGNGSIIVQYSNGEKCNNSKELFSTEIMFNCVGYDDDVGEYPTFIANENNCKLFVLWNTQMACPISRYSESKHNCVLKLSDKPDTGLMFDLIPLRQPTWYNVKSEDGRMFQINICGPVINGSCESGASACELNSAGNESIKTLGFFNKSSAHYSVDKGLFFTSKVNKHSVAEVHLVCDVFVHNSNIKFISVNNGIYTFEMNTYLACIYTPVDCVTYDLKGNKFDLNIYRKKTDNWKVTDTRDDHSDVSYYFNVCGELIPNPKIPLFRDRTIASCSVGKDYKRNLGFLNSGPVIQSGSLILRYTDGDACADNTSRYSTLIIFKCSKQDQYPVFVSESESCVVTFLWATPAACPIKSAVGQYCKVREPVYSNLFDLTLLHNEQKDYYINSGRNDSFRINICGSLVKKCAEYTNVSVCLIRDGVEIPIGFKNDRPDYTNGRIMLKFTGSRCQPSANESIVYITFLCDHEPPEPLPSPQFFISDNLCNFYFVWHVREVCPPYQTRSCRMTDSDGLEYDLTPLSLTSNNHMALFKDYYNNTLKFLINVCRSIVFGYGATCEFNAGICMENQTLPNSHNNLVNMGEVNNEMLKFDDGVLSLHYNNGDLCREPAGASLHYSSVIYFYCDWNAVESMPQVIQAKPCTVEFVWNSSVACPLNINTALVPKTGNCTATNPATGFIFNLSSLKDKTYNVNTKYGHFVIAICGNISEECGGVCNRTYPPFGRRSNDTEETAQNYGYGNSDLQYRMRSLYLNYTGGVLCKNNVLRNTIIEFVCGMEHSSEGLEYIEDMDGCTTLFVWTTDLVCEKKKSKCQVNESGIFINLTPLMNSLKNYKATSDDGHVFFINICRPLVPVPKLNCGGSSAVCMADEIPGGDYIDELNLGSPYFEPVFDEGDVILKYFSGTPCLHRSKNSASRDLEYSSSFRFICNVTAGQGSPVLKHIGDCHYDFEWKTNVTCVPGSYDSPKITDKCVIHNSEYNTMIDLRPLFLNDINEIYKVKNQSSVYILNLCGSLTVCNGKRVCKMGTATYSISYGDVCDVEFSYENGNVMKLSYNHGPLCQRNPNLSFSSVVWFRCDPAAGNGTPILLSENETKCFAEFEWRSDIVCKINEKKDKDTTSHTTAGLVVGLLVLFILLFGFFVYCRKPLNRRNFRNKIDVLLGRRRQDILCHYMRLRRSKVDLHAAS